MRSLGGLLFWVAAVVFSATFATCRHEAQASTTDALWVLRSLVGEAGDTPRTDHPAILQVYTLRHKLPAWRDRPIVDLVRQYSAAVRPGLPPNPNRLRMLRLGDGDFHPALVRLVSLWMSGEPIPDPCPGSEHYGSHADARHTRMHRVACAGPTLNVFLRPRRTPR